MLASLSTRYPSHLPSLLFPSLPSVATTLSPLPAYLSLLPPPPSWHKHLWNTYFFVELYHKRGKVGRRRRRYWSHILVFSYFYRSLRKLFNIWIPRTSYLILASQNKCVTKQILNTEILLDNIAYTGQFSSHPFNSLTQHNPLLDNPSVIVYCFGLCYFQLWTKNQHL